MNNVRIFEPMTVNDIIEYLNTIPVNERDIKLKMDVSLENGSYELKHIEHFFITTEDELVITYE